MTFYNHCLKYSFLCNVLARTKNYLHFLSQRSHIAQKFSAFWLFCRWTTKNSSFLAYFYKEGHILDLFFKDSWTTNVLKMMTFSFFIGLRTFLIEAFRDSIIYRLALQARQDWNQHSLRVPAWILFGFIAVYASLELMWGKGFNRDQMFSVFIALLVLWTLTYLSFPSRWFTQGSKVIDFFRELIS